MDELRSTIDNLEAQMLIKHVYGYLRAQTIPGLENSILVIKSEICNIFSFG